MNQIDRISKDVKDLIGKILNGDKRLFFIDGRTVYLMNLTDDLVLPMKTALSKIGIDYEFKDRIKGWKNSGNYLCVDVKSVRKYNGKNTTGIH